MNVWDLEQKMFGIPNSQVKFIFLLGFIGSLTSHYRRFRPDVDPMLNHASNKSGRCEYKAYSEIFSEHIKSNSFNFSYFSVLAHNLPITFN